MSAARQPSPHESAHLHVAGAATYIDDIPELRGTLHCAIGMSTEAHATIQAIDSLVLLRVSRFYVGVSVGFSPVATRCRGFVRYYDTANTG